MQNIEDTVTGEPGEQSPGSDNLGALLPAVPTTPPANRPELEPLHELLLPYIVDYHERLQAFWEEFTSTEIIHPRTEKGIDGRAGSLYQGVANFIFQLHQLEECSETEYEQARTALDEHVAGLRDLATLYALSRVCLNAEGKKPDRCVTCRQPLAAKPAPHFAIGCGNPDCKQYDPEFASYWILKQQPSKEQEARSAAQLALENYMNSPAKVETDQRLLQSVDSPDARRKALAEHVQIHILKLLFEHVGVERLTFYGGNALHLLYDAPRYSEDLDLALVTPVAEYDHEGTMRTIEGALREHGFPAVLGKCNINRPVYSARFNFPGLYYAHKLSPAQRHYLMIKVEINTTPPKGGNRLIRTLQKGNLHFTVQHNDPATLMAGKLNAILTRPSMKARDLFDIYYLMVHGDRAGNKVTEPNLDFLNNALSTPVHESTPPWTRGPVTTGNWRSIILEKLEPLTETELQELDTEVQSESELEAHVDQTGYSTAKLIALLADGAAST